MFYILTILISMAVIILGNSIALNFSVESILNITINVTIGTIGVIAWDGLGALIVRRLLPMKWFLPHKKAFNVSKNEHKFYNKIKIKAWKDKVPELGMFTAFSKSDFKGAADSEYLKRFILESNYGVICHLENAILGFAILFIPYWTGSHFIFPTPLSVWLPIFLVNFVLSILPVFVLRYTTYTLNRLYEKQIKKDESKKQ